MPLVGFRPTKARLIIENSRDSVLVMIVVLDADDAVELTTGGTLRDVTGSLRIRERRFSTAPVADKTIGSVVYVDGAEGDAAAEAAKFQINVTMAADKFATLLRVANAGGLPTKFFVDAGGRPARGETVALGYRMRAGERIKVWDNHMHRTLAVSNFVVILPIDMTAASAGAAVASEAMPAVAGATSAQVEELMDDMLVFQSDTRTSMFGLVCVLAIVSMAALVIGIALFFR